MSRRIGYLSPDIEDRMMEARRGRSSRTGRFVHRSEMDDRYDDRERRYGEGERFERRGGNYGRMDEYDRRDEYRDRRDYRDDDRMDGYSRRSRRGERSEYQQDERRRGRDDRDGYD